MTRNIEKEYKQTQKEFSDFLNILKDFDYVFVGSFANIPFKHFRASSHFIVQICDSDFEKLKNKVKNSGYFCRENEIYGDTVLIKIEFCYFDSLIDNRIKLSANIGDVFCDLYFPNYENHKKIMLSYNSVYCNEDIEIIESENPRVNCRNASYEWLINHFLEFIMGACEKHNHIKGSESCVLCKEV